MLSSSPLFCFAHSTDQGSLLYCHPPPGVDSKTFQFMGRTKDGLHPSLTYADASKLAKFHQLKQKKQSAAEKSSDAMNAANLISEFDRMVFEKVSVLITNYYSLIVTTTTTTDSCIGSSSGWSDRLTKLSLCLVLSRRARFISSIPQQLLQFWILLICVKQTISHWWSLESLWIQSIYWRYYIRDAFRSLQFSWIVIIILFSFTLIRYWEVTSKPGTC